MTPRQAQGKGGRKAEKPETESAAPVLPPDGGSWVLLPDGRLVREEALRQAQDEALPENADEGEPA